MGFSARKSLVHCSKWYWEQAILCNLLDCSLQANWFHISLRHSQFREVYLYLFQSQVFENILKIISIKDYSQMGIGNILCRCWERWYWPMLIVHLRKIAWVLQNPWLENIHSWRNRYVFAMLIGSCCIFACGGKWNRTHASIFHCLWLVLWLLFH